MKHSAFFTLSIILFLSCQPPCTDSHAVLTSDDLSWIPYSGSQWLSFKNQQGVVDSLYVSPRNTSSETSYIDGDHCHHIYQSSSVNVTNGNLPVGMTLSISATDKYHAGGAHIYMNYSNSNLLFDFSKYVPHDNISINGNIYNNVYILARDTFSITTNSPYLWKIYFTKAAGILRLELTKNGEVWEKI